MAFDSDSFGVNGDVSQRGQGPTSFTYLTLTDTKDQLLGEGYFAEARDYLDLGSFVFANCICGTFVGVITSLNPVQMQDRLVLTGGLNFAYGSWEEDTPFTLTTTTQFFTPNNERVEPLNIFNEEEKFTVANAGVYNVVVERLYTNTQQNPAQPYEVIIEFYLNGDIVYSRTSDIGSANSPQEPAHRTFCSPFVYALSAGDVLKLGFKTPTPGTTTDLTIDLINTSIVRVV